MLIKIAFLIALLLLGNQALTWLMAVDLPLLREVSTSLFIALLLQPLVMHQFR